MNAAAPDPFTVTATTPDTDIDHVQFFRCSNASTGCGSGSWVSLGSDTTVPYTAQWNVDGDGNRALRAVATDFGSNTAEDTNDVTIDRVAPSASLDDPGANLRGTVSLTGSGSDPGGSGVASLTFQRSPAGAGTWTTVGTDTSSPYSVSFDTTAVADGLYDLRAVATDNAGNTTLSTIVANRRVDNTAPSASLDDPGANLRGTVTLTSTASDAGSGIASRVYAYSPAGAGTWRLDSGCLRHDRRLGRALRPARHRHRCRRQPDHVGDGRQPAGRQHRPERKSGRSGCQPAWDGDAQLDRERRRLRDRHPRLSALPCRRRHLDDDSGCLRHDRRHGRALRPARDRHRCRRQPTTSATVANRRVDNTAPAASLDDPGANLRGTVTLTSTASDAGSGVATRTYAYSPAGAGTWTTTPAAFDTTTVTDGLYDLRVTVTDNAGNQTTSATVANRRVDNTDPSASLTALPTGASSPQRWRSLPAAPIRAAPVSAPSSSSAAPPVAAPGLRSTPTRARPTPSPGT